MQLYVLLQQLQPLGVHNTPSAPVYTPFKPRVGLPLPVTQVSALRRVAEREGIASVYRNGSITPYRPTWLGQI